MNLNKEMKEQIWEKATIVEGYDSNIYRKDACGAWIMKDKEGDRDHLFGWEIDHIFPLSLGGGDDIDNLRPLHWQNNLSKGDDFPRYKSSVTSNGSKNIEEERWLTVNDTVQKKLGQLYKTRK
jgi:5-methylcytosine-specific restriction endonuclease McrA